MRRREFLASVPAAAVLAAQNGNRSNALTLWYKQPATKWTDALPLGNGSMGAMVFGGVERERFQLNDDTLWSGPQGPGLNPDAPQHLPEIRKAILEDHDYVAADQIARKMQGPWSESYLPLIDLFIEGLTGTVTDYRRELDLDSAISRVSGKVNGQAFLREAFISYPDKVLVIRVEGYKPEIKLDCAMPHQQSGKQLTGKAPAHVEPNYVRSANPITYSDSEAIGMRFCVAYDAVEERNATILLVASATAFRSPDRPPDTPLKDLESRCADTLTRARTKGYSRLREDHLADHRKLFRRMSLDIGRPSDAPTDERLKAAGAGNDDNLIALYFQYGRYLLITSSRPGSRAANLQGIWNQDLRAPWSGNYTANINVQMNYWPAETCNLSECALPLLELIEGVSRTGRETARVNYAMPGWVAHHNIDVWCKSTPVGLNRFNPQWANWNMSAPWLCWHVWEHYRFTNDVNWLRERGYPLMKGAAEYCEAWLVDDREGHLTTAPSVSPENAFKGPDGKRAEVSDGVTMDIALIRELFANTAAAAMVLNIDGEWAAKLTNLRDKLRPYRTGKYGQLLEWAHDFEEVEPGHRHLSHLYPLHPGSEFTWRRNRAMTQAAQIALERRLAAGSGQTGWSRAWVINFWARLEDGEKAHESLVALMRQSTGPNLFDTHPAGPSFVFQIDGNFGAAAGIAELLLQSHEDDIAILPALPKAWADGSVRGLRARGGITVDIAWNGGRAREATLTAAQNTAVQLRPPKAQSIKGGNRVSLKAGRPQRITFS